MTLNSIVKKLLKKNINQYVLLSACILLTVSFITSVGILITGQTVQGILVSGGSAMQLSASCYVLLLIGSVIFIGYVFTLFLKYKSKELGIFMCLGIPRKEVSKIVKKEIYFILPISIVVGILLAYPLSISVWSGFTKFIITTSETKFEIGFLGYVIGIIYSTLLVILMNIMLSKYLKKLDIMKILKADETIEEVREVKPYMTVVGIILIPLGIILMDVFLRMPKPLSLLGTPMLGLTALGIYLICARLPYYGEKQKKKNPKKYYDNIVYYNLLKLKGKQYVSAIFVTTIIIAVSTFSLIFILSQILSTDELIGSKVADYSIVNRQDVNSINEEEIRELAEKYNVNIKEFITFDTIKMISDYYGDESEGGYNKYNNDISIISESTYNKISKDNLDVKPDSYVYLSDTEINSMYMDKALLTNNKTRESKMYNYQESKALELLDGVLAGEGKFYIIDDEEYKKNEEVLDRKAKINNIVFFTGNWQNEYEFGREIRDIIINRSNKNITDHQWCYHLTDEFNNVECIYENEGKHVELNTTNPEVSRWWKYAPSFKVLSKNEMVYDYAVYLLLFIFISTLGFISAGIILYVKSLSSIWNDKKIYKNISYLGAKKDYIQKCISKLQKILFVIPTVAGSISALIMLGVIGAGSGTDFMIMILKTSIPLVLIVYVIQFICYIISKKKIIKEVLNFEL